MSKLFGLTVRSARKARGFTQAALAKRLGVTRAAVGLWEAGTNEPSTRHIIELCLHLRIDLAAATSGRVKVIETSDQDYDEGEAQPLLITDKRLAQEQLLLPSENDVPIFETASLFIDKKYHWNRFIISNSVVERVPRPKGLRPSRQVYAFYVAHENLYPRYEAGDLIFADVNRRAKVGDHVLVRLTDEHSEGVVAVLGRLMERADDRIVLVEYKPQGAIILNSNEYASLDRICPWGELF